MQAKSIRGSSPTEMQAALIQSMADGFKPTVATVFISIKQDREVVCEILKKEDISILGATSSGEFIDGHQSQGEMAILLMEIPKTDFCILFENTRGKEIKSAAQEAAATAQAAFSNPALILCSTCISSEGNWYPGPTLIHTLENALGKNVNIFGGMAGADGTLAGTFVFTITESTDEGFAILVLDNDKIEVHGMAISGWKPLGKVRTVTKSEDAWVYGIDGQPALDMYLRYLGQSIDHNATTELQGLEQIGFFYPFLALDAGEPILRTPMAANSEKNGILLDTAIPEGKQFQFTMPPDFDIVESVLKSATTIKYNTQEKADALLVFSCLGRLSTLGPMAEEENEGLHKIWKAPMAGFFTYGEYGKTEDNAYRFHSTTCSWVALKENNGIS